MQKLHKNSRNIVNQDELMTFIRDRLEKTDDLMLKRFIATTLRRYLINKGKARVYYLNATNSGPKWINQAIERGDTLYWLELKNTKLEASIKVNMAVDTKVKKQEVVVEEELEDALSLIEAYLLEYREHSNLQVPELFSKAQVWIHKKRSKESRKEGKISVIKTYENGVFWVSLDDRQALVREGLLMHHCVGDSQKYSVEVENKTLRIFSLRDANSYPHCTIAYKPKEKIVTQIKGKFNKVVSSYYAEFVKDFLQDKTLGLDFSEVEDLSNIGLALDVKSRYLNICQLPENTKIKGNLVYNQVYDVENLPDGLIVNGDLILTNTSIKKLPKRLEVRGELNIKGTKVTKLPTGLKVGYLVIDTDQVAVPADLSVSNRLIVALKSRTKLPDGMHLRGSLTLFGTLITELPKGLKVDGFDCDIHCSLITQIPSDIQVAGKLDCRYLELKSLPDDLTVGWDFLLNETPIEQLPNGLSVGHELNLTNTKIKRLPADLQVGGPIILDKTPIEQLPDNFEVQGNLGLRDSGIEQLPNNLRVRGWLDIRGTRITKLPDDLVVDDIIYRDF